ncbi:MAG: hypothetical protein OJF49_004367 [Ktedonobacterales bacterium]|jgi:predicted nucleic acid-binding protein|nr:MAG: hypothetical protein OJF49_004367 [Ktedonobacterales bacterium]
MPTALQNNAPNQIRLCVDASLVLHLLLPYERDPNTESLWTSWASTGVHVVGPALLYAEVTSVIRLRVATGKLTPEEGERAFSSFNDLRITRIDRDDLHLRAWELAKTHKTQRAYDMMYLALAELEDIELWTGDERFINSVGKHESRVHWAPAQNAP